jgi:hypothetical protein
MNGMSDLIDDQPGALVGPPRVFTAGWLGRVVRGVAFIVLVVGAFTVVASFAPASRSTEDFTADLAAGRVSYVEYQSGLGEVRWVSDWVRWRQARLTSPPLPDTGGVSGQARDRAWLNQQIAASGRQLRLEEFRNSGPGEWPFRIPWPPLRYAAGAVWVLALLHMLSRGGHRVANRWAWFWMFTFGQIGALLYLVREPVPLWRSELPDAGRAPMRGGIGFLSAILLSIVAGVVGFGIAFALR